MLELRDYQNKAIEKLREGFAAGHRVQMLYLPCGGGKTETAIAMMDAAKKKGNRAAMILDRVILCNQTSQRLDKYGIDHGVLQAGHWRYRPYEPIQVCSAQTLEKRGSMPGMSIMFVDEAHDKRKQTIEFIKNNPDVRVIGLSASPCTKGLGDTYTNIVSPVSMKDLVQSGSLVPLRVFIAKDIDMTGAKKVAGEWTESEAAKRGMQITGDVVTEWIKKTHDIFGKPVKTLVFCSGVDHGADLSRKFSEQGYNFVCVSYKDDDEFKRQVMDDFAKPDTKIHGLIATNILSKGLDVPDVMIGISARPFSKSLSSHIQQIGRIMRPYPGKEFGVWLDHSNNYLRFRQDWDEIFESGVSQLDDAREKPKKEPSKKEREASKCPVCSALWPGHSDTCYNCGHVRERRNKIAAVEGEMVELTGMATRENKQDFWNQMVWMMRYQGWSKGRAAHTYKDKFGVWPRGLIDTRPEAPSPETRKFVDKKLHAFLKKIGRR
jgi:superfamily II DNA or RNA helicase